MKKDYNILVFNPGSTSSKIAYYRNGTELYKKSVNYDATVLAQYAVCTDQAEYRYEAVQEFFDENHIDPNELSAVVGRGGGLYHLDAGAYVVNEEMLDCLCHRPYADHASNLGAVVADMVAKKYGIPAFTYDGVTVDQLQPLARLSGLPLIPRRSGGHPLNEHAMALRYAEEHGKNYNDLTVIVAHLGGGISLTLHHKGRMIDVCTDEDGAYSPERAGALYTGGLLRVIYSGKYTEKEVRRMMRGNAGLAAHLGTTSAIEVEKRIAAGDEQAKLVYEGMAYQIAKCIGGLATVVDGKVDAILITGGIAHSKMLTDWIRQRVEFIAPVHIYAGEHEMEALAGGCLRVLRGEETAKHYKEYPEEATK